MATCTLRIGDRVALASVGGTPEVEYLLFDPGEIELLATGPGMVQEVGYKTVAELAIERLQECGITWRLALETASAMQPTIAMAYARGPAIRRVATFLGAAELLDGFRFDAATKTYEGRWLDLAALALDTGIPSLTQMLQCMHLLALLEEVDPDDTIHLVTRDQMVRTRPGGRSYKRYNPPNVSNLPSKLRAFSTELRSSPQRERLEQTTGPSTADLLDLLRDRIVLMSNTEAQDRLRAIEKAVGIRERPMRGPLADPELWALDEQLSTGRSDGVIELVDSLEKSKGKQPATAYLRMRAALLGGREPPKAVAERISSLALTMPAFVELELLAAEAWNAAGDPKRALPFVRDLISNASVADELRVRESQQFAVRRPSQVAMEAAKTTPQSSTMPAPEMPAQQMPEPTVRPPLGTITIRTQAVKVTDAASASSASNTSEPFEREPMSDFRRRMTQPMMKAVSSDSPPPDESRRSGPPSASQGPRSTTPTRRETPPMMFGVTEAPERPSIPMKPPAGARSKSSISGTWVGPPPTAATAPPARGAELDFDDRTPAHGMRPDLGTRHSTNPPPRSEPGRQTSRPALDAPRLANWGSTELMRGASQPPFRSDSPDAHLHVPKAPPVPHTEPGAEMARILPFPEGLSGVQAPIETLPRTVIDARVQFTFLARDLGCEYEEKLGITLLADITGIEEIQRVLLARYADRAITTPEAAADVRRHGAFLSEVLARTFSAFWVDIGPNDVGYWAMVVPPGTRIWPFGRILRLIAMQHNERDLVSYFLELQGRAAGR